MVPETPTAICHSVWVSGTEEIIISCLYIDSRVWDEKMNYDREEREVKIK
jgi:hypothetical protein